MNNYYICAYCGKSKSVIGKKRPKCNCKGGYGATFMTKHKKETYKKWIKNNPLK